MDPPATNMMKAVRMTGKTKVSMTAKTLCSTMPKTTRKKLHWGKKDNRHHQNRRRIKTTMMKMTTETVPRTSTATATAEVAEISAP